MAPSPVSGNSFVRRICAKLAKTSQMERPCDGVRGLFALESLPRGALVLRVPLHACISPATRACSALSSFQIWAGRLRLPLEPQLQLESTISSDDSPGGIVTFKLQPFEAALCLCVALRYFDSVFGGTGAMCGHGVLRSTDRWFLSSIPMSTIDMLGTESPFVSELGSHSSQDLHSCMEQVAESMSDYLHEHWLSENQRRLVEASGEDLRWHLLSAIYAVRARVLHLPVVGGSVGAKSVPVVAPLLQMFNHASGMSANCAAVVAAGEGAVVLRTLRHVKPYEELSVDYRSNLVLEQHQRAVEHPHVSLKDQQAADRALAWESRYQLPACR